MTADDDEKFSSQFMKALALRAKFVSVIDNESDLQTVTSALAMMVADSIWAQSEIEGFCKEAAIQAFSEAIVEAWGIRRHVEDSRGWIDMEDGT